MQDYNFIHYLEDLINYDRTFKEEVLATTQGYYKDTATQFDSNSKENRGWVTRMKLLATIKKINKDDTPDPIFMPQGRTMYMPIKTDFFATGENCFFVYFIVFIVL